MGPLKNHLHILFLISKPTELNYRSIRFLKFTLNRTETEISPAEKICNYQNSSSLEFDISIFFMLAFNKNLM